jgi:hypothetical protein
VKCICAPIIFSNVPLSALNLEIVWFFFCLVVMMECSVIDLVEDLNGHQENDGLNVLYRGIFVSGLSLWKYEVSTFCNEW